MNPSLQTPPPWQHGHDFGGGNRRAERGTRLVMWITALTMVIEIAAGWAFNSMALLADGWHMSSHAVAIGLSALAYAAARRLAHDARFAFGTWKIEVLGGFSSALFLMGVAVMMVAGSVQRLLSPQPIGYPEALSVGALGLLVNLVCAWILHRSGQVSQQPGIVHAHSHSHSHGHTGARSPDLNLRAAYLHVVADAATSVLALLALAGGWWLGWDWLDPVMGMVGAVLVALWARGLLRETSAALLDRDMDHPVVQEIREALVFDDTAHETALTDLHVWRVGSRHYACALTLVSTDATLDAARVRRRLAVHEEIVHATIEIHHRRP